MNESALRHTVAELLASGHAHASAERALGKVAVRTRGARVPGKGHSLWEQLEHMRIAQEDILRYTLDPAWRSPPWPEGYWPRPGSTPTPAAWRASTAAFFRDLDEAVSLARDPGRDLTAEIPHGEGRTYLRQLLLIADHNAYHLGQIVQARKALGDW